jgi:UPF0271 protein
MILSNPNNEAFEYTAKMYGITLIYEVFADRNYNDDGTLVSRMLPNAVITDELEIMQRVKTLKEYGFLESINSKRLYLKADTICVHGDTEDALNFIKSLYKVLN